MRETFGKIFHLKVKDDLWDELTLPIKGKNTKISDATLGIGLTKCNRIASSTYLAAMIDASELRDRLLNNENISTDISKEMARLLTDACSRWAKDAKMKAETTEEVLRICEIKKKPNVQGISAKTQSRLAQVVTTNAVTRVKQSTPKLKKDWSRRHFLRAVMEWPRAKQWLICSIINALRWQIISNRNFCA